MEGVWKWWEKLLEDPANMVNWSQFKEQFEYHTPEPGLILYAVGAMGGSATERILTCAFMNIDFLELPQTFMLGVLGFPRNSYSIEI